MANDKRGNVPAEIVKKSIRLRKADGVYALITARGGSSRLPNKNIKMLCGHPMLAWSIIQARASKSVKSVWLTTDSLLYASIGRQYGANVILRPVYDNGLAANYVFCHAIKTLRSHPEQVKDSIDLVITMLPTDPLRKPCDIDDMVFIWRKSDADIISPIAPRHETCILENKTEEPKQLVFDKGYEYADDAGGMAVCTPDHYLYLSGAYPDLNDKTIDKLFKNGELPALKQKYYRSILEPWQAMHVDHDYHFIMLEALMGHKLLKGRNMDIYSEYAGYDLLDPVKTEFINGLNVRMD